MDSKKFNDWRVFPRLMVSVYLGLIISVSMWYMALTEPTGGQAAFAGGITGMIVPLLSAYMATGNKP
jgi:hypothetical protein